MKVYKKPVQVEAMLYSSADSVDEIVDWMWEAGRGWAYSDGELFIITLEGEMHASPGDWIIKGVQGEFYPCKPDIFAATYTTTPPENLHYDEETMVKVYSALARAGCGRAGEEVKAVEVVSELQNAGILFRERKAE